MVVALAAGLMGCEHDPVSNATKFEGTWRSQFIDGISGEPVNIVYTFTDNAFTLDADLGSNGGYTASGTFTFTDTDITFSLSDDESWTQDYTLTGNKLYLDGNNGAYFGGTFTLE
jgi:hypothetical protein